MTIRQIDPADYHADPLPRPSLNSTIAKILLTKTPAHAWTASPRLNPDWEPTDSDAFDLGRAAHAMLLGRGDDVSVVVADNWATKAAKAAKEEARASGRTPMLEKDYRRVMRMTEVARGYLKACGLSDLDPARSELMASAEIDGVACRMMADHAFEWPLDPILDVKTAGSVSDHAIQRAIVDYGYDVSEQWYREVWKAATGEDRDFVFLFIEKVPPYACRLIKLLRLPGDDADWSEDATEKCAEARRIWRTCLETGEWPCYPPKLRLLGAPIYHRRNWADAETVAPSVDALQRARDWQAPQRAAE